MEPAARRNWSASPYFSRSGNVLRALRASDDFDADWLFHKQQEHERNHASHYAEHHVPQVVPSAALLSQFSSRCPLKIVKKNAGS